jgi:hypothetical protein
LFTGLKVTHPGARQYAHPKTSVGGPREEGMSYQQRNKNDYWISIAKNFFIKAVVLQRLAIDAGQFLTLSADICGALRLHTASPVLVRSNLQSYLRLPNWAGQ